MNNIFDKNGIIPSNIETNPFTRRRDTEKNPFTLTTSIDQWVHTLRSSIMELLVSRFEWFGLPEDMPIYHVEKTLVEKGQILFFQTKTDGIFALPGTPQGFNVYYEPLKFTVISPVIKGTYDLNKDKCVLVKNNLDGKSEMEIIDTYLYELADIKSSQSQNRQVKKTPFILTGNERTINSVYEQLTQISQGRSYIAIDTKSNSLGKIDVFDLDAPDYSASYQQEFDEMKGELLEFLGINSNPNPNKKERMITDEVDTNAQETNLHRNMRLRLRQDSAKKMSKLFGVKITVNESEVFEDEVLGNLDNNGLDVGNDSGIHTERFSKPDND